MSNLSLPDLYAYSLENSELFDTHLLLEDEIRQIEVAAHRAVLNLNCLYFHTKSSFEKKVFTASDLNLSVEKIIVPDAFSAYDLILSFYGIDSNCGRREEWERKIFKVLSQDYFQTRKGWEESYLDLCRLEVNSEQAFADMLLAVRLVEQRMKIFEPSHDYSLAANVVENRGSFPLPPSYQAWVEEKEYVSEWEVAWMQNGLLHTYHPKKGKNTESNHFSTLLQGKEISCARSLLSPDKKTEVFLHRETKRVLVWDKKTMEWAVWQMNARQLECPHVFPRLNESYLLDCGFLQSGKYYYDNISFNGKSIIMYDEDDMVFFNPLNLKDGDEIIVFPEDEAVEDEEDEEDDEEDEEDEEDKDKDKDKEDKEEDQKITYSKYLKGTKMHASRFSWIHEWMYKGLKEEDLELNFIGPSINNILLHFEYTAYISGVVKRGLATILYKKSSDFDLTGYKKDYMFTQKHVLVDYKKYPEIFSWEKKESDFSLGDALYECEAFQVKATIIFPHGNLTILCENHFDLSVTFRRKGFSAEGEKWEKGELLYKNVFPRMKIHPDFYLQFSPNGKYLFFCRKGELICLDWMKVENSSPEDLRVVASGVYGFITM